MDIPRVVTQRSKGSVLYAPAFVSAQCASLAAFRASANTLWSQSASSESNPMLTRTSDAGMPYCTAQLSSSECEDKVGAEAGALGTHDSECIVEIHHYPRCPAQTQNEKRLSKLPLGRRRTGKWDAVLLLWVVLEDLHGHDRRGRFWEGCEGIFQIPWD